MRSSRTKSVSQRVTVSSAPFPQCVLFIRPDRVAADERCAVLLEVDPENRERRNQLKKEKERLQRAQTELESLTCDDSAMMVDDPFLSV